MRGRRLRPDCQMTEFREALNYCSLLDIRYWGSHFTWCNNRDHPYTTWVRLDRAVTNMEWLN